MTELSNYLSDILYLKSDAGLKEKVDFLGDTIYKIMALVIKLPEIIDNQFNSLYTALSTIDNRIGCCETRVGGLEVKVTTYETIVKTTSPPPPPPVAKVEVKEQPSTLRGNILKELKVLFEKRNGVAKTE